MVSVGADFGLSNTGIVLLDTDFEIVTQNLIRAKSKGAKRLVDIEQAFHDILIAGPTDVCELFIEGYAYGAKYQRESLAELGGVIRRYLHLARLNFWVIPPMMLKSFVTNTGNASKNYMKKCVRDQWHISFKSDDVCDAYGLARLGAHVLTKQVDGLNENQIKIVNDVIENEPSYKNTNTAKKTRKR